MPRHERLLELTRDMRFNPGASKLELAKLRLALSFDLPPDYLDFMCLTNGAKGPIGRHELEVYSAGDLLRWATEFGPDNVFPGLFFFATNDQDTAYAYDVRSITPPIVSVPLDNLRHSGVQHLAWTFLQFIETLSEVD